MGQHRTSGLIKRGEVWHIDKIVRGVRIRESTGTSNFRKAEELLAHRVNSTREKMLFGLREDRTFRAAATKFLNENQHKRTIKGDALLLKRLDPYIGHLTLKQVHMGTMQAFIDKRRAEGVKTRSVNNELAIVRHILNLAAEEWMDERGLTWLERAPKIKLFPVRDARAPYPLSQQEQSLLLQELPGHLAKMALFKVNTGCRDQEVCGLRWDEEVSVPELETSVFIISGDKVKNGQDRLVVLNRIARSVVDSMRGLNPEYVFVRKTDEGTYCRISGMNNTGWKNARRRAADKLAEQSGEPVPEGFRRVRVHDLKHYLPSLTMSGGARGDSERLRDLPISVNGCLARHPT
jgi:integrase